MEPNNEPVNNASDDTVEHTQTLNNPTLCSDDSNSGSCDDVSDSDNNSEDSSSCTSSDNSDSESDDSSNDSPPPLSDTFNLQNAFKCITPETLKESNNIINGMFKGNELMSEMMTSIFDGLAKMDFNNDGANIFTDIMKVAMDATTKMKEKHDDDEIRKSVDGLGINTNNILDGTGIDLSNFNLNLKKVNSDEQKSNTTESNNDISSESLIHDDKVNDNVDENGTLKINI